MVCALLEGRKTQTRRVLSRLLRFGAITQFGPSDTRGYDWHFRDKGMRWHDLRHHALLASLPFKVGDRLWVREAIEAWETETGWKYVRFGADGHVNFEPWPGYWKRDMVPGIHMPRRFSRLTLTVTDVRVQLLQEIGEFDAIAEGIELARWTAQYGYHWRNYGAPGLDDRSAVYSYKTLWNSLHGHTGSKQLPVEPWSLNPWVIAVTFAVVKQNIDRIGEGA